MTSDPTVDFQVAIQRANRVAGTGWRPHLVVVDDAAVGDQYGSLDDEMRSAVDDQKGLLRDQVAVLSRQVAVLEAQVRVLENTVAHMRDIWRVISRLLDRHMEPGAS